MAVIHVLDKHTAELIAAGEVVERPASVVKELLENAIDAGASQITVTIESGGVKLIEISDNGSGIEAEYIPTAFIRHATSKIRTEDDLNHIHTLGFRGEALASIASVARVEVLTRTENDECASIYRIEGGEDYPLEPGARGVGTTIRVQDLFYNTPARMKFLKKDSSEGTFVADIVGHVALSHPEVSFKFVREGKLQYVTPGDGKLRSAAYAVLGREFSRDLMELDNQEGVYRVWGLITQPRSCRASRSMQYFYINGRYVRNRTMMAAMETAFKGTTMQGKFPGGILLLEMPADLVDVNVHPAKTEVRFARENDIFDLVYHAVKLALAQPGTGERRFAFEEDKKDEESNKSEMSDNATENDVKKNNFTGLSAVIPGQAEPGTLHEPLSPSGASGASLRHRQQHRRPVRHLQATRISCLCRTLPRKSRQSTAGQRLHRACPSGRMPPCTARHQLPRRVSLKHPPLPQRWEKVHWTLSRTVQICPNIRTTWRHGILPPRRKCLPPQLRSRPLLPRIRRNSWALTCRKALPLCAMWVRFSRPISLPSVGKKSASLISTLPTSASFSRSWRQTMEMFRPSCCWSRWWWSCRRRKRLPSSPTLSCWKAQDWRSMTLAATACSCALCPRTWNRAAPRICWWSWPISFPRAAAMP